MPRPPAKQFSGIFVSYRRDDVAPYAGRLSDRLGDHFGKDQIFMDRDNIPPGADFVHVIEKAVGSCQILIAIIGRDWLLGANKTRFLDNPNDFVRLEIAAALNRDIPVIPVLVEQASMPTPQDLPDDLTSLARRNAIELTDARWRRDVDQLIDVIEEIRKELAPVPQPGPLPNNWKLVVGGAALIVAIVIAAVWFSQRSASPNQPAFSANSNMSPATVEPAGKLSPPDGMVLVPGGEFTMGRDEGDEYERPAHRETLKAFFIDTYEVTCGDYEKFVKEDSHPAPQGSPCLAGARKPVTGVTWDDAVAFCHWRFKRLPTEQEWEFAARGTDGRRYPWGNEWRAGLANAGPSDKMVDVGSYPSGKSPFGAFDMVGNAWEWTTADLTAYPGGRFKEPEPGTKVLRGGNYKSTKDAATATYRLGWKASGESEYATTGFRCVKDAAESVGQR